MWNHVSSQMSLWRQLTYTRKFIERVISADATAHAVRDADDRVLVESARGKTYWSRAMLKRRLMKRNTRPKPMIRKNKPAPPKARVLRRLVPGGRKMSLPKLLEETADYIGALEMQVKAMALLDALVNGAVPAAT